MNFDDHYIKNLYGNDSKKWFEWMPQAMRENGAFTSDELDMMNNVFEQIDKATSKKNEHFDEELFTL